MPVDVLVVVVTYNSEHVINDALDSLPGALGALDAEVVVVDNGSTDSTPDIVRERSDCLLVESSNVGYAAGLNRGVREGTSAPSILVLNPDVVLGEGSVARMFEAITGPSIGIIAPQVRSATGDLHHSLRREPSLSRSVGLTGTGWPMFSEYLSRTEDYAEPAVVDWALGAVLLISRICFERVGGMDESYFLYSEETDFCLAARDLGYQTRYEPDAVVMHIGGQSGQSARTHTMQVVNRIRCYRRRHGVVASWAFFVLTLLREAAWIKRNGDRSRTAVKALLRPSLRPPEIGVSQRIMPD